MAHGDYERLTPQAIDQVWHRLPLRRHATSATRLTAPQYQLTQGNQAKHDQQHDAEQEEYPRNVGHGVAKPVLITPSIRDIRNQEEDCVCDSEIDQTPTPDNHLQKPTGRGFASHRATSPNLCLDRA